MSDHAIFTKQEVEAVNKDIRENSNGVLDPFKKHGGWTLDAKAGKLKDGTFAISREVIEELQNRGGTNATKIGGVDLKNRPDQTVLDSDRVKG
ncbi:MAG: hypothetical protein COA79_20385 [Planctomycetota bacterium]|nr:MAG: hypothetical protein COA79_20385 [Planctomycetota bacterium]